MAIPDVSKERIIEAIGQFDIHSRESRDWVGWEQKRNHKYALKYEDNLYPVKEIIRLATGYRDFSGGTVANNYLERLGFDVVQLKGEEDLVFEFEEADLVEGITGTRWRGRLSPILERETESILESRMKAVPVSRRTEIYIYDERFRGGFPIPNSYFAIPKYYFYLNGVERRYAYGLYVEKGVATGDRPERIMDGRWSWHRLVQWIDDARNLEEFKRIVIDNDLEIHLLLSHPDAEILYRPVGDSLSRVETSSETSQEVSFKDFAEYISTLPENQWCDLTIRKEEELGPYRRIQIEPIIDAYDVLAPIFFSILPEKEGDLVLIGAAKDIRELDPHKEFLKENGEVALWYSYPIREEYVDKLRERDTFKLLVYWKGQMRYASRVEAFESIAGSEGIESPWQDYTIPQERGKSTIGATNPKTTKTWFLVNDITEIEPPEQLSSYVYYDSGKPIPPSALKNSFGYARKGSAMPPVERNAYAELLEKKKQIIFYGPPGTGKTYVANRVAHEFASQIMYVTFHPAFGYEEFVEGITADIAGDESKQIGYCLREGIFKKACKYALGVALGYSEREIDEETWSDVFDNYMDAINAGEHPDFSHKVVLVVDEINRGDIAKIFGELVTLLEADKRLGAETEIKVKLPYSNDTFGVPPNLYLIGTMNTADVSIALVDIALRRRFAFCEMMPDLEEEGALLSYHKDEGTYELIEPSIAAVKVINERISREKSLGRDKQIGHSFFFKVGDENDLFLVWRYEILPLLEEYCYGDYSRINEILFADQGRDDCMDAVKGIVLEPPDLEKMIDGIRESSGID